MNKNINLDNIPKTKSFGKEVNDWSNSKGCTCDFTYGKIKGRFKIVDYNKKSHKLVVLYKGRENEINTSNFINANFGAFLGIRTKEYKIPIGEKIVDNNRNLTITDRKRNGRYKIYNYTCNICNWTGGRINEEHLLNGVGCSCCSKRTIVPYKNDVYTTNPEYIKYFKNIEDTHKTTSCNKQEFSMICPICGNEQMYSTDKLSTGFSCKKCGDGIPYGEKFIYSLLKELNIEFITQLSHTTFSWCKSYKYDFYIPSVDTIIEVNGRQHYMDNKSASNCFYRNDKMIDKEKEKCAKENGIANYIVIDCRKSNIDYIKRSILESGLLNLLSVSENKVNWLECDKFTSKSFLRIVCDYKNNHCELSSSDIGNVFGFARTTIQMYMEKGSKLGICIYDKELEKKCRSRNKRKEYYLNLSM